MSHFEKRDLRVTGALSEAGIREEGQPNHNGSLLSLLNQEF